jgi:hypothetical protein
MSSETAPWLGPRAGGKKGLSRAGTLPFQSSPSHEKRGSSSSPNTRRSTAWDGPRIEGCQTGARSAARAPAVGARLAQLRAILAGVLWQRPIAVEEIRSISPVGRAESLLRPGAALRPLARRLPSRPAGCPPEMRSAARCRLIDGARLTQGPSELRRGTQNARAAEVTGVGRKHPRVGHAPAARRRIRPGCTRQSPRGHEHWLWIELRAKPPSARTLESRAPPRLPSSGTRA